MQVQTINITNYKIEKEHALPAPAKLPSLPLPPPPLSHTHTE